ncbi:MAG: SatD family protein [Pseudomonadota bacterium]
MATPHPQYLALIGDIVASKRLAAPKRAQIQANLDASLKGLNRQRKRRGIASAFTITLGDEFQALFERADALFPSLFAIERDLYPTRLRFAIGVGRIVTRVHERTALGMDGPAFHEARRGIDVLRNANRRYGVFGLEPASPYLDAALALISHQRETWKPARLETLLDLLDGRKAGSTADRLGLSLQAIYKNISAGALEPITQILDTCTTDLNRALGEQRRHR